MKKYTVDEPEFNKTLIITETTDTGHADNINKAPEMAFENTLYLEKTKLDADGGDISEAVIKAADEIEDDEYPIPASGDKPRTFLGKTKKFLGNIKDWMTGVCLLGQIVNNCVTDNAKLPLSAAQGAELMRLYNVLNTNSQKTPEIQYGIAYIDANEKAITSSKVTFKNEFTDIPLVVCSIRSSTTNPKYGCISAFADHDDITSKGFTIKVANNADEILFPAVAWIAVCKRR